MCKGFHCRYEGVDGTCRSFFALDFISDPSFAGKVLLASPDIIAVDTASTNLAQQFTNVQLEDVGYIQHGQKHGLGTMDIEKLHVRRMRV